MIIKCVLSYLYVKGDDCIWEYLVFVEIMEILCFVECNLWV